MKIAIPSYRRAGKIETLKLLTAFPKEDIIIFLNDENQKSNYEKFYLDYQVIAHNADGIAGNRNNIINHFETGEKIVMLDDDLSEILQLKTEKLKKKLKPFNNEEIKSFFEEAFRITEENKAKLWGIYPVKNDFYMDWSINNSGFVIGSCCGVIKNHLKYDPTVNTKEDYDYTIQNILEFKKVIRFNYITVNAKHYNNPGGCSDQRKEDKSLESRVCHNLVSKWPQYVRLNPKRENEIIINI